MDPYETFRNRLNIRQKRNRPRAGSKPTPGAKLVMDDFRIVVRVGLSDELWRFLAEAGFRKATYSPDRRHYRDVPSTFVTRLSSAAPAEWQALLLAALQEASKRPRIRIITRSESIS